MSDAPWYTRNPTMKSAYKAFKKARNCAQDLIQKGYYRFNLARSHRHARRAFTVADAQYDTYLRTQLEETLLKKRLKGEVHFEVIPLIDLLLQYTDCTGKDALCVGCRNRDEIVYFRKQGANKVVGIDLYSDHEDIQIMDMHDLKFSDNSFDFVYSRHSFEHAFDKRKAALEFVRVLRPGGVVIIEVPGNYKGGADYNRFDQIEDVTDAFEPHIDAFLHREYSKKEESTDKMDIVRVIFFVKK